MRILNKLTSKAIVILTLMIAVITSNSIAQPLGVKVAGVDITDSNSQDILGAIGMGTGSMKYDKTTHTLTLDNVNLECGNKDAILATSSLDEFNIVLIGDNVIRQTAGKRIDLRAAKNTISGTGTLDVNSVWGPGIYLDQTELEISGGCTVIASGDWGICGFTTQTGKLTINNSTVMAKGGQGSICDLKELKLIDCALTSPAKATIKLGVVLNAEGGTCTDQVIIEPVNTSYELFVKGIKVTDDNKDNILGDNTANYKPDTKTLFLNGATIEAGDNEAIMSKSDIIIDIKGINKISSNKDALLLEAKTYIRGDGKLHATSTNNAGIKLTGEELTFDNISEIKATGKWGISGKNNTGANRLIAKSSSILAKGTEYSIGGFESITMEGCHIFTPKEAIVKDGTVTLNDAPCTEEISISNTIEYPIFVSGKAATSLNYEDILGDGTAAFDPEEHVLRLNNYNFSTTESTSGVSCQVALANVTIILSGDNSINTPYFGMIFSCNANVKGNGTLKITSGSNAVVINHSKVSFLEGPTYDIEGAGGINGFPTDPGELILQSVDMKAKGDFAGSIANLKKLKLANCEIIKPQDATVTDGSITKDGEIYKDEVIIKKITAPSGIESLMNDNIQIATTQGKLSVYASNNQQNPINIYTVTGKKVYAGYVNNSLELSLKPGCYIVNINNKATKIIIQ